MGKPRLYDPDWVIERDEFHPDPRVAAVYADHAAHLFTQRNLKLLIEKLEGRKELTPDERERLCDARLMLDITEAAIKEFNEKEQADE